MAYKAVVTPKTLVGRKVLESSSTAVAPMYKPNIVVNITPNKQRTAHHVTIRGRCPLIAKVDGINKQTNLIKVDFAFTSLQNVDATVEATELLDGVLAEINAIKAQILAGRYTVA